MQSVLDFIKKYNLIAEGDKVGVACSGGRDSMCLLHFLNSISDEFKFSVMAINIDHDLRENSKNDSAFVVDYCNKNGIKVLSYKLNVKKFCEERKIGIEHGARDARYRVFASLIKNKVVNKIALGHHMQDQAETILLNIFRGAGVNGAGGMEPITDGGYIRPLLNSSRMEIQAYVMKNEIPYVDDESNFENDFSRNYIRNMIMPLIRNKWHNADQSICSFGLLCKQDNAFINSLVNENSFIVSDRLVKIPTTMFVQDVSVISRGIMKALKKINCLQDIERKHIRMIKDMAMEAPNGTKINLPNGIVVIKEYNYITLTNKNLKTKNGSWKIARGVKNITGFGAIETYVTRKFDFKKYSHLVDYNKIPKDAVWRYRKDGDIFEKFGGGTKSLSDYFIDKKIPRRLRDITPVLASGNEILIVAGVEISNKVKIDDETKTAYGFNVVMF